MTRFDEDAFQVSLSPLSQSQFWSPASYVHVLGWPEWLRCAGTETRLRLPIHVPLGRTPSGFRPPIQKLQKQFPTSSAPPPSCRRCAYAGFLQGGAVVAVMDACIMHQACIFSWPEPPDAAQATILPSVFTWVHFPDHSEKELTYFCCYFAETHLLVCLQWCRRDLTAGGRGFAKSGQLCFAAGSQAEAKILIVPGGSPCKSSS